MEGMSRILPLPPDAISQIHSSKHITSLQGVVLALLENSLDAGASKVEISVDFRRGGCSIEDNGQGILLAEFLEDGGLGHLYHTSKHDTPIPGELHGSTGTYLASLAALSLISVTSRHMAHDEHATLTFHHGKVAARHVPAPLGHELLMSTQCGTSVTVRDLFGNMPVRVKQRALSSIVGAGDEKAWQELKCGVVALLLAWPKPCKVKLRDSEVDNRIVNLSAHHPAVSTALTEKSLHQLGGAVVKSDIRDALPMLFQAGLASAESRQSWVPISTSTLSMAVRGAISLEPVPTKHCQFISIGIRPCSATSGHNELFDAVNKTFVNSSFGSVEDAADIDETEKDRRKRDRRYKSDGYTQKQLQGRKSVDRWPMFVLQVKLREQQNHHAAMNNPSTSDASLKAIINVLEATVTQWLAANHFRPRKRRPRKNEGQQGPAGASSSPVRPVSAVRAKIGTPVTTRFATPSLKRPSTSASAKTSKKRRVLDLSGRPMSQDESTMQHSPSAYFNTLSRIKSGKGAFYDGLYDARKPATAPAGQLGSTQGSMLKPAKAVFRLPVLEAGELGSAKQPERINVSESTASVPAVSECAPNQSLAQPSSDDFGSVDDAAMVTAADAVEGRAPTTRLHATMTGHDGVVTSTEEAISDDPAVDWTDPVTKQVFQVNARTGVVLPARLKTAQSMLESAENVSVLRSSAAINTAVTSAGKPLSLARRFATPAEKTAGEWLPGFLKDWKNPVFRKQDEERIPMASFDGPGVDLAETCNRRCTGHSMTQHFDEAGTSGTSKLSKAALRQISVIRQVDEKFILCKMPSEEPDGDHAILVLVDQHAASERVILEKLLVELCLPIDSTAPAAAILSSAGCKSAVATTLLERRQHFQISGTESELFAKHALHFAQWGILYDLSQNTAAVTASQVRAPAEDHKITVRALPPGIAERCTLFPNLLIELLRSQAFALVEASMRPRMLDSTNGPSSNGRHGWLKHIGSCPKGIIDMLNSRACRSAIMFNDVLTREQCEELLVDLSECAFPFICAHGRVSMVPLVRLGEDGGSGLGDLGTGGGGLDEQSKRQEGFIGPFKRWRRALGLGLGSEANESFTT